MGQAHYKTSKSDHNEEKVVPLMAGMSLLAQPYENRGKISDKQQQRHCGGSKIVFKKNLYGKPEVDREVDTTTNYPKLKFNISHTDSLMACGVTVNVPVGIDVEDKTRKMRHDVLSLAKRFYSSREVEFLSSIADMEARRKEFIKLWTLKEAYVKALGKGFSASPFNTFSIIRAEAAESYNLCGQAEGWKFRLLELAASSHYAAICIEGEDDEEEAMNVIVHRTIPFVEDELISDWKLL
ncbi:hypothetical protein Bca4012_074154 [Brassica carinata]